MRRTISLGLIVLACREPPAPPSASVAPSASAAPFAQDTETPLKASAPSRIVLSGALVDVPGRTVVRTLTGDAVLAESMDTSAAYLCISYWRTPPGDSPAREIRAYDLADGTLRWAKPVADCRSLAVGSNGVLVSGYGVGAHGVRRFDAKDGAAHDVGMGKPVVAVQAFGAQVVALHDDGTVDTLEGPSASVKLPFVPEPLFGSGPAFVDRGTELCGAHVDGIHLDVACVDAALHVRFALHESLGGRGGALRERGPRWIVASTSEGDRKSIVVDVVSGTVVARVDAEVAAAVRTESGELEGLLVTTPKAQLLDLAGRVRWTSPEPVEEAASALSRGGSIFVATYAPIRTGAALVALDGKTGLLRWRADLQLLPISHSIYRNYVELDFDRGVLAIRGHESGQDYFELFAPSDGTSLFRSVRPLG